MKILFLSHQAEYMYGGEICTLEMMRVLASGHEVYFASPLGKYFDAAKKITPKVFAVSSKEFKRKISFLPQFIPSLVRTNHELKELVTTEKIEIIHATSLKSMVFAWYLGKTHKIPVIWHHHDILPEKFWNRSWLKFIALAASKIIVPSKATKEALVVAGIDSEKIQVIYNGFDASQWQQREAAKAGAFVLAMIGEISRRKGSDLLLPIYQKLKKMNMGQFEIRVIGEGLSNPDFAQELNAELHQAGAGSVKFLGLRSDIKAQLQEIDLLLVPSRQDPLPTVIVEAFLSGVPVLASNVGGIAEMLRAGENGFLCTGPGEYAKRIEEICSNKELWQKLSLGARKTAEAMFFV